MILFPEKGSVRIEKWYTFTRFVTSYQNIRYIKSSATETTVLFQCMQKVQFK